MFFSCVCYFFCSFFFRLELNRTARSFSPAFRWFSFQLTMTDVFLPSQGCIELLHPKEQQEQQEPEPSDFERRFASGSELPPLPPVCNPHNYCKPIAKKLEDRRALQEVIIEAHPRFFLGSDSAPHPRSAKEESPPAAGVFTQPKLMGYVASAFHRLGCLPNLRAFACSHGASFLGLQPKALTVGFPSLRICKLANQVPSSYPVPSSFSSSTSSSSSSSPSSSSSTSSISIIPFLAGQQLPMSVTVCDYGGSP
eukprot:GHVT01005591.1.p1 GENE.GHVT01005591.1~~GHVT01005591.1.p1  ORF type:complete len:253 (-),score=69.85 GHVT01005591.1:784-1542(-)